MNYPNRRISFLMLDTPLEGCTLQQAGEVIMLWLTGLALGYKPRTEVV